MALTDLLWACPVCGTEDSLRDEGGGAACTACNASFERGRGAELRITERDGTAHVHSAAELLDRLPSADVLLERGNDPVRSASVSARVAEDEGIVRLGKEFLNRFERFAEPRQGTLMLRADRVEFAPPPEGQGMTWEFGRLTAVQPSSSSLQLKGRDMPVVSFRFHGDSVRLWEELLHAALQRYYRARGKGDILELQPRIVTR